MITGLIQPKKWRKWIAVGAAIAAAAVGTTCVLLRTIPDFSWDFFREATVFPHFILKKGKNCDILVK